MRITDVETILLRLPQVGNVCDGTQDAFVVRVMTDEGVIGIGEADSMPTVLDAVFSAPLSNSIGRGLRELLVGQDPLQIEPLWERMMAGTLYLGTSGVRLTAISGVEMALWDIAGKVHGVPVSDLLGGGFQRRLRAYASVLFPDDPHEVGQVREKAAELREAGFTAMKFGWGGFGRDRRSDVALVRAAREGAGDDVDLLIDGGLCWDLPTALERAQALAEFGLYWLEAPLPHEPVSAYAALCARSPIRIACESAGGFWESVRLLREGRLHVLLPDASNVGGIGQWKRIAQAAATEGAWCVPHNFSTGILSAASLHLLANQPEPRLIEWSMEGSPLNTALVQPAKTMIDGYVASPTGAGLGVELDWSVVERFRIA